MRLLRTVFWRWLFHGVMESTQRRSPVLLRRRDLYWFAVAFKPAWTDTDGMNPAQSPAELSAKKCVPCEGGVLGYSAAEAQTQVAALPLWRLTHLGTRIRRDWTLQNFRAAIKLLNTIAALAEQEQHHPDLHLEGYCSAWVEMYTHAIGGLSENDFVLAAKIDAISGNRQ